jgi:hypothetical protein
MHADPMHMARLANLEGALCALLRSAAQDHEANEAPDGLSVTIDADGIEIEYTRGGISVAGEGL